MISPRRIAAVIPVSVALACAGPGPRQRSDRERVFTVEGRAGKLRVSDGGSGGVPVVFLHGLGSDLEAWRAQLDHLRPARRAIAYDQRGHGGSDAARDGVYTIASLVEDLDAMVAVLGLDRFVLVGHSLSGTVLTAYAAAHPERIAGLVYADAVGDFRSVPADAVEAMARAEASPAFGRAEQRQAFSTMLGTLARPATAERVLASVERIDVPAYAALRRSMAQFDARPLLGRYGGPRFAIERGASPFPAVLFSAIAPEAPRTTIDGVSHWLMMDDPAAFNRALDAFLGAMATGAP